MFLPPHVEEDRLNIRTILDRFNRSCSLTVGTCVPGFSLEKFSKKTTAKSAALGCGVLGLAFTQSATRAGCALVQESTYAPWVGSAPTQAVARTLWRSAHWATIPGFPWYRSCWNHASTSGATSCPALGPFSYLTMGPTVRATRSRSR